MKKLVKAAIATVMCCLLFVSCDFEDEPKRGEFGKYIVGEWSIDYNDYSTIYFYNGGCFDLKNKVFGKYWINKDNKAELKYICDDEDTVSTMLFKDNVCGTKIIRVENLPKHKGESDLYKKKESYDSKPR